MEIVSSQNGEGQLVGISKTLIVSPTNAPFMFYYEEDEI